MNGYLLACGSESVIAAALCSDDRSSIARDPSSGGFSTTSEAFLDAFDDASMSSTYSFPGNLPLFAGAIATPPDCSSRVATAPPGEERATPTSLGSFSSGSIARGGTCSAVLEGSPAGSAAGIVGSMVLTGGELPLTSSVCTIAESSDGSFSKAIGETILSLRPLWSRLRFLGRTVMSSSSLSCEKVLLSGDFRDFGICVSAGSTAVEEASAGDSGGVGGRFTDIDQSPLC